MEILIRNTLIPSCQELLDDIINFDLDENEDNNDDNDDDDEDDDLSMLVESEEANYTC